MERMLTFHSGEEFICEEGGILVLSRYLTETGGLRTVVAIAPLSEHNPVPVPALTDRDIAVLCGRLLGFAFAPPQQHSSLLLMNEDTGEVAGPS